MHLNQKLLNHSSHSCMCSRILRHSVGSRIAHLFTSSLTLQNQLQKAVSIIRERERDTDIHSCLVLFSHLLLNLESVKQLFKPHHGYWD